MFLMLATSLSGCFQTEISEERASLIVEQSRMIFESNNGLSSVAVVKWSPAITELNPEAVLVDGTGLYIRMWSLMAAEEGYFVPRSAEFSSSLGTDPSYELLYPNFFSYEIRG